MTYLGKLPIASEKFSAYQEIKFKIFTHKIYLKLNNKIKTASIIFSIFGLLFLVISYLIALLNQSPSPQIQFWVSLFKDIGIIGLTVVIINFLWNALGGSPTDKAIEEIGLTLSKLRKSVKLLEDSKETGANRILAVSGGFGTHTDWMKRLKSSEETVDLMGFSLYVWLKGAEFEESIVKQVERGVNIRVLIMDEENINLKNIDSLKATKGFNKISIIERLKITKGMFAGILDKVEMLDSPKGTFEFKTIKKGFIHCQICRTDERLTMVQYLFSELGSRTPLIEVIGSNSGLFKVYSKEFETLWKLNS